MVALHTPLRHLHQSRTAVLEASQPPCEPRSVVDIHTPGGVYSRSANGLLRHGSRYASTVSSLPCILSTYAHAIYDGRLITVGVFLGLTLFTFQSKVGICILYTWPVFPLNL